LLNFHHDTTTLGLLMVSGSISSTVP
jgi:hypothetical protein